MNFDYDGNLDNDFVKHMGILGAQMVNSFEDSVRKEVKNNKSLISRDGFMSSRDNRRDTNTTIIDSSSISEMSNTLFNVRVAFAGKDIVRPLSEEIEGISMESNALALNIASDQITMLKQIHLTLLANNDQNVGWLQRVLFNVRRFYNHPGLMSLTVLGSVIGKTVGKVIDVTKGLLLGWRRQSDADRIVESVDKLREFMMTGQVDERRSLFKTFATRGFAGLVGRGIENMYGKNVFGNMAGSVIESDVAKDNMSYQTGS